MEIKTKYEIGQHIWIIYLHNKEVCVFDDIITEISMSEDGLEYWCKLAGDSLKENEIVKYEDEIGLANRIKELLKECEGKDE